jgi:hypothetical protein
VCFPCPLGWWRAGPTPDPEAPELDLTPSCQLHRISGCPAGFVTSVPPSPTAERVCAQPPTQGPRASSTAGATELSTKATTTTGQPKMASSTTAEPFGVGFSDQAAGTGFGHRQVVMIVLAAVVLVLCAVVIGSYRKRKTESVDLDQPTLAAAASRSGSPPPEAAWQRQSERAHQAWRSPPRSAAVDIDFAAAVAGLHGAGRGGHAGPIGDDFDGAVATLETQASFGPYGGLRRGPSPSAESSSSAHFSPTVSRAGPSGFRVARYQAEEEL